MPELLSVLRPLASPDHMALRAHMDDINHSLPEHISVKWRQIGNVAITLLERGEYGLASTMERSSLEELGVHMVWQIVKESLRQTETGSHIITAKTTGVELYGKGDHRDIAYSLESHEALTERLRLTEIIDTLNEPNFRWRDFRPHVTLASVDRNYAEETTEAFGNIMPAELRFLPPIAKIK